MHCPSCQHENPAEAAFCEECGTKLVRTCPSCGHEARSSAKFCLACGTSLAEQVATSTSTQTDKQQDKQEEQAEYRTSDGERRQLTVMFILLFVCLAISQPPVLFLETTGLLGNYQELYPACNLGLFDNALPLAG